MTVSKAADALGISQDAVRKRISRGTIAHDRDESGRVYVYLTPSETVHNTGQDTSQDDATKTVQDAHIRSLEDQIAFLQEELRRKDAILLNLTERIPELEAPRDRSDMPSGARRSPETAPGEAGDAWDTWQEEPKEPSDRSEPPQRRSWWREFFGFGR